MNALYLDLRSRTLAPAAPAPAGLPGADGPGGAGRLTALRAHGEFTLAYNTLAQAGLTYFHGPAGPAGGYVAYKPAGRYAFVLGDPVAAPDGTPALLRAFLESPAGRRAIFCQVTDRSAPTLAAAGFYLNDMGPDHVLRLPGYSLSGKKKEWLRYAANWCDRRGFVAAEDPRLTAAEVRAVSDAWRATRPADSGEITFLNRPFRPAAVDAAPDGDPGSGPVEPGVRRFSLRDAGGALRAFVFFDPLYRGGRPVGYVSALRRRCPDAPPHGEAAVMKHAIEAFRAEGREALRLGLSPLADGKTLLYRENRLLAQTFRLGFRASWLNRGYYALENHAATKRRYRGDEERTYYASRKWFNVAPLITLAKLMGLFGPPPAEG